MTEPLRRAPPQRAKNPDELGDVLASIRRLIAQEGAALQDAGAGGPVASGAAQTDPTGPVFRDPLTLRAAAPRPVQDSAALSLAVDAAAARMADTARRIEAARLETELAAAAPFRLNPEALIPPAEQPAWADPQRRLTPGLLAEVTATPVKVDEGGAPIQETQDMRSLASQQALYTSAPGETLVAEALPAWPETAPDSPSALAPAAVAETQPRYTNAASDLPDATVPQPTSPESTKQETAAMLLNADRAQATITPHPSAAAPLHSMAAPAHPETPPVAGEGLLVRQLLREAIRAELSAELGERLDGELRLLVRQEIAAALSAALSDALRLPATR